MASNVEVSPVPASQKKRFTEIDNVFVTQYGKKPEFYARSPGRVNLIGEHIDYCGYSVLPMAIEQDIVIAVSTNDSGTMRLANTSPNFKAISLPVNLSEQTIDKSKPLWYHYFLCGYRGILEHFKMDASCGLDLVLDGTIPKSAGLSSSSALVCCAAIATMHANKKSVSKLELSKICQNCEYYIGTEGGGMDQAISLLAEPGKAKLIEFNPLRSTNVTLPPGAVFVISNCCVELNKAATAHFNTRVAECRLATQVLAKSKNLDWRSLFKLGDLQKQLDVSLDDMVALVASTLHKEPYSKDEICDILGVTADELNTISLSERTWDVRSFKLHDRAMHVYGEAARVGSFKSVCDSPTVEALQRLGDLMNASHNSCSAQYQCSCDDLDELVNLCRDSGAFGSRLTGAGWGGCAVSLVPEEKLQTFFKSVTEGYYKKTPHRENLLQQSLFATKPGAGAAIYCNEAN